MFARFWPLLIVIFGCAATGIIAAPRPAARPMIALSVQGDSLRAIIGWDYPASDGAGPLDSVVAGWSYGTQPAQFHGKRPPVNRDTAYFRLPAICEHATGAVALVSWRRGASSAAVIREFEFGLPCPAPGAPTNVRWVDSLRRVP